MSAAKANNNKDTYKATGITLMVFGVLYLLDKLVHFAALGLPWVMQKDNFLLYTAIISCWSSTTSRSAWCWLAFGWC